MRNIKDLYWKLTSDESQGRTIVRFLQHVGATPDWRIVDVGCGYGRNLRVMRAAGLQPVGIEINPDIRTAVQADGFTCMAPDDPELHSHEFDAVLMSHIIEHFDYKSLLKMMNGYLDKLDDGGYLIIATPLLSRRFYDNFDHVKPYTPIAIEEVFGRRGLQVQFQAAHEMELVDLWIRRRPFTLQLFPSLLRRRMSFAKVMLGGTNILLQLLHLLSLRLVGTSDGWVGIYRKTR